MILSAGLITPLIVAFSYSDDISKMKAIFGEVTEILERKEMERPEQITEDMIDATFGKDNLIAINVPSQDYTKVSRLAAHLESLPEVRE